jgi:hypothetical protein
MATPLELAPELRRLLPMLYNQNHNPTELLSEAFQLASTGGCDTGLRTRSRHVYNFASASSPLSTGSAAAFGSALAQRHGSRLLTLRLPFAYRSAVSFLTSPTFRKVHGACPARVSFPVRTLTLSRLSASFVWLTASQRPPESLVRADAQ